MKKVISFCLYGTNATYILGMKENILLASQYFPEWIVRIYYNSTVPEKYIVEFKNLKAECILKENLGRNKMNWEGMFWRWMPLDDNDVAIWISRDADSRLSKREADIVNQWMQSGKTLHCIRDHKCHYHAIMGGMFGINNKSFHAKYKFKKISDIISDLYKYYKERPYNVDQEFLNSQVWNLLKDDVMAHISNKGRRIYNSDIEIPSVPDFIGKQYRIDRELPTESIVNCDNESLKHKMFKIKSEYNDDCLDVYENKVVLKRISNSESQLWKLDENNHIIHVTTKEYLSWDSKNDLIVSNNKHIWTCNSSGFITCNNKAIDIKGGLLDTRNEVWMYKLNYSEAQQWKCVTKEYYTDSLDSSSKENKQKILLILNHDYHHKNKKGMEMICKYLNYKLVYGSIRDIQQADIIYCPRRPFNASKWPNKYFIFGPHHSIFPEERLLRQINNANNSVYIQPSPWARDVWINKGAEKYLPIKSFPFPVEIDLFNSPKSNSDKTNIFIMFKHRHPNEISYIEGYMRSKHIGFRTFIYNGYKQEDYLNYLQTCKYGIWVGRHESQGFALEEALSCNIPLLVWSVTNMRQQHGWSGCPDVPGTTIAFWDERCGEYFEKQEDFEKTYETFMKKIETYKPREFIENTVSVKQCATNFENLFVKNDDELYLDEKKSPHEYKVLTCADSNYFNGLKSFINNFKKENLNISDLIVYDIGLTSSQLEELSKLQKHFNFIVYTLDYSKYPEHINLNLDKWKGLYNTYAFKAVIIYNTLQKINCNLIYTDVGIQFKQNTFSVINNYVKENNFWTFRGSNKGSIESLELNHRDTLKYFNIELQDMTNCRACVFGINYSDSYVKELIDEWYKYSLIQEVANPMGANRNNHRQDQTLISCLLHKRGHKYVNLNTGIRVDVKPGCTTYYNKYTKFGCKPINSNKNESLVFTNTLEEAIETYMLRKNVTKEILLENFIVFKF